LEKRVEQRADLPPRTLKTWIKYWHEEACVQREGASGALLDDSVMVGKKKKKQAGGWQSGQRLAGQRLLKKLMDKEK